MFRQEQKQTGGFQEAFPILWLIRIKATPPRHPLLTKSFENLPRKQSVHITMAKRRTTLHRLEAVSTGKATFPTRHPAGKWPHPGFISRGPQVQHLDREFQWTTSRLVWLRRLSYWKSELKSQCLSSATQLKLTRTALLWSGKTRNRRGLASISLCGFL